ncbi:hypothetical protein CVT24_010793 [Panaeolus cyanescens]|uniref:Uncharacterized protein n=1 Tax=Panaeolus cyanescens TaxID=181874 RepID=A0A409VGS1_9AGAR|nr:hypothetical protein CVT24_010793 [Panaeolus cyanescens]
MSAPPLELGNSKNGHSPDVSIASLSLNASPSVSDRRHPRLSYDLILQILSTALESGATIPFSTTVIGQNQSQTAAELQFKRENKPTNHGLILITKCSIVCREFHMAAASLLYRDVVVSPKFSPVLNLREGLSVPASSNLSSALLPHNAPYVLSLEISGYISPRPGPRNPLPALIPLALKTFTNLRRIVFTPSTYHELLFEESLPLLKNVSRLKELTVGAACFGGERPGAWGAEKIVEVGIREKRNVLEEEGGTGKLQTSMVKTEIQNDQTAATRSTQDGTDIPEKPCLRVIGLVSPGRAILERVPDWLEGLKRDGGRLTGLHLKDNCGSVTPGVLRAIMPHVKDSLTDLTLGLSYSLADEDVFNFVGEIEHLRWLKLRYYWQLKQPPRQPSLRNLSTFIVSHPELQARKDVLELCKWVRRAIKGSPLLEVLKLCGDDDLGPGVDERGMVNGGDVADDSYEGNGDNIPSPGSFDPLLEHLTLKHKERLRILDLGTGFMSVASFKKVATECQGLEVIRAAVGKGFLNTFSELSSSLKRLHTLDLRIVHVPYHFLSDGGRSKGVVEWAQKALIDGPDALRRIRVQGVLWECRWEVGEDGQTRKVVEEVDYGILTPPWRK